MSKHLLPAGIHRVPQTRIRECWLDQQINAMFQQTFEAFVQIEKAIRETRRRVFELDEKIDIALMFAERSGGGEPEDLER